MSENTKNSLLSNDVREIIYRTMYTFRNNLCNRFNLDVTTLNGLFLFDDFLDTNEQIVQFDDDDLFVYYILDKDGNKYIRYNHLLNEMTYVYEM